jgi:hypothetical protein
LSTDPEMHSARGKVAANTRWSQEKDRTAATAPMRQAFLDQLREQARELLGPDATDEQITKSAENLRQAHLARIRLAAIKSRRAKAKGEGEAQS